MLTLIVILDTTVHSVTGKTTRHSHRPLKIQKQKQPKQKLQKKTASIILQSSNNRDDKPPNEGTAFATRIGITLKPESARPNQNAVAFPCELHCFEINLLTAK